MWIRNLGSGSSGNATVVAHGGQAIMIDAGLSRRRIASALEGLDLLAVLITHRHGDHLGAAAEALGAPLWIDKANARAAARRGQIDGPVRHFDGRPFRLGPFRVTAFALPHPGDERWSSHGFFIESGRRRLVYATDLGHVPSVLVDLLPDADAVFLESNHDPDMELESDRSYDTVEWVLSDNGHLSNEQCAEALAKAHRARTVILGHLSEDCNRPELALRCARKALRHSTRVYVAHRDAGPALTV